MNQPTRVIKFIKELFKQRHKWEFDDLTSAMFLDGINLTQYDFSKYESYQKCKLCGKKIYLSSLSMKISKYCENKEIA